MIDDPDNTTRRYLRRLGDKVDRIADNLSDLSSDIRGVQARMSGFSQDEAPQDGAIAPIRDRLEPRPDLQGGNS